MVQRRTWEALANSGAFPLVKKEFRSGYQGERALPQCSGHLANSPRFRDVIIFWVGGNGFCQ